MKASKLNSSEYLSAFLKDSKEEKKFLKGLRKLQEGIAARKKKLSRIQLQILEMETAMKDVEKKWREAQKEKQLVVEQLENMKYDVQEEKEFMELEEIQLLKPSEKAAMNSLEFLIAFLKDSKEEKNFLKRLRKLEEGIALDKQKLSEMQLQILEMEAAIKDVEVVYDRISFMEDHRGGEEVLLSPTGKDATNDFEEVGHSENARDFMRLYHIGEKEKSAVALKKTYIPSKQIVDNPNKNLEIVTRILQIVVPIMMVSLALVVRYFAKEK